MLLNLEGLKLSSFWCMQYDEELVIFERMKYLCSAVPVFGSWIKQELETVKSLQRLCRLTIRNATPTEPLKIC